MADYIMEHSGAELDETISFVQTIKNGTVQMPGKGVGTPTIADVADASGYTTPVVYLSASYEGAANIPALTYSITEGRLIIVLLGKEGKQFTVSWILMEARQ